MHKVTSVLGLHHIATLLNACLAITFVVCLEACSSPPIRELPAQSVTANPEWDGPSIVPHPPP